MLKTAGCSGQWNIFDGLQTYGKVKQARASLESAKVNYDDSVHQVELEVQQAYANLQTARKNRAAFFAWDAELLSLKKSTSSPSVNESAPASNTGL